jgi:hypothetical protein
MGLDYFKLIGDPIAELNIKSMTFPSQIEERWKDYEG